MKPLFRNTLNSYLDKIVHPKFNIFHKSWYAYQVCGYTGLALAILLCMAMAVFLDLSPWVMSGVAGVSILTFLGLAMITKIIIGEERLIYYHHEIAIMIMAAVFLWMIHQPVLPCLDITILGIGTFLICGRVGCLMVGCCHGRPGKWGVCYGKEHVAEGFTQYFAGVRLFPIQAVESLWVFGVVLVGILFIIKGRPPGETMAWYIITYDMGRFVFEFVRGDPDRPYHWGFSEAQWISVILMGVLVWAELADILIFHVWHGIAAAAMILTMMIVVLIRHFCSTVRHKILNPGHIREVAEAIDPASGGCGVRTIFTGRNLVPDSIPMRLTSLGIRISADKIKDADTPLDHYALSSQKETMSSETAATLADLIMLLKHPSCSKTLVTHNRGVFHLLVHSPGAGGGK